MNETNNQLIQTGFTLDRLHQDNKISDEAYVILKDRNKQAIIYTRCCTELVCDSCENTAVYVERKCNECAYADTQ